MITAAVTVLSLAFGGPACGSAAGPPAANPYAPAERQSLEDLYLSGRSFDDFLAGVSSRRNTWHRNYRNGTIPEGLAERLTRAGGTWRLLVVAEDWCGDSANTIPYLARLVEAVQGIDMRILDSTLGRTIMRGHRTPDGRAATPTVVVLDEGYRNVGCWVERPSELQRWFLENEGVLDEDQLYDRKYAWYDDDRGQTTLREIGAVIQAAASGSPLCGST